MKLLPQQISKDPSEPQTKRSDSVPIAALGLQKPTNNQLKALNQNQTTNNSTILGAKSNKLLGNQKLSCFLPLGAPV